MARVFSTGVEVPTAGDRHPSEAWWSRVGATTNAAILSETGKARADSAAAVDALRETVTQDYVDRATATQYGIPGPASKISIGTVQGGVSAAASMTGSAPNQTLNLTLPQGPRGPEGPGGAFQMVETTTPGLFEVSDVPNEVITAAAEAAVATAAAGTKVLPDGTDLNTLRDSGTYMIASTAAASTMINLPTNRAGFVRVSKASTVVTVQEVVSHYSDTKSPETYTRTTILSNSTSWSPWDTGTWNKGPLPEGTNLASFNEPGAWSIGNTNVGSTMVDWPTENGELILGTGHLENLVQSLGARRTQRLTLEHNGVIREFVRTTGLVGSAPAWQEPLKSVQGNSGGVSTVEESTVDAGYRHEWLLNRARARRGGVIGTNGLPVVSLRFDHWSDQFENKVLPLLRKYQIPGTLNLNADRQNAGTAPNTKPLSEIAEWALADGIEIANHGATHTDATDKARVLDEIQGGLERLQEGLGPRVIVDAWHGHGSGTFTLGPDDSWFYGNLDAGTGFDSTAGKLITRNHAFIEGKSSGFFQPLTGEPVRAASHMTIDVTGSAGGTNAVETAKKLNRGITLYVHPGTIGQPEKITLADYETFLAYLAAEREAGRIVITTVSSMSLCDARSDHREELLVQPALAGSWAGVTGWSFTGDGDSFRAVSTASAGVLSQSLLLFTRFGWAMGSMVELVVKARATAGAESTLRLAAEDFTSTSTGTVLSAAREVVLPASGEAQTHRLFFTLPARRTTDNVKVSLGRAAGGAVEIVGEPTLRPI